MISYMIHVYDTAIGGNVVYFGKNRKECIEEMRGDGFIPSDIKAEYQMIFDRGDPYSLPGFIGG